MENQLIINIIISGILTLIIFKLLHPMLKFAFKIILIIIVFLLILSILENKGI